MRLNFVWFIAESTKANTASQDKTKPLIPMKASFLSFGVSRLFSRMAWFLFLIVLSAFSQLSRAEVEGAWTYTLEDGGATITASTATGAVTVPATLGAQAVKRVGNNWPPIFGAPNTTVRSVTIPNSVTSIGSYAFSSCTGLTRVNIPNSVTGIGAFAFAGCSELTSLAIPSSVTSVGVYAFQSCSGLTSVTIPNSVTSIENNAFAGCSSLTSVKIPDSVTSIGQSAFDNCTSLRSVTIPSSVTSIGEGAFEGCSGLTRVPTKR